jgi:hypothetical protein
VKVWHLLFWGISALACAAVLYALHRLALWLEARGHLYYRNKKATGTAMGSLVALQRAIEPNVQHVIQVTEQRRLHGDQAGSGQGEPEVPGH